MLMRQMRWTYQQYRSQPAWVIDILDLMAKQDAAKEREEVAQAEARAKAANQGKTKRR